MSKYEFQQLGVGFSISGTFPKQWGIVVRGGKRFYRNYRRELKNGKGLTWLEMLHERGRDMLDQMARITAVTVFHIGEEDQECYDQN